MKIKCLYGKKTQNKIFTLWTLGCIAIDPQHKFSCLHLKLIFIYFPLKRLLQNTVTLSILFQACVGFFFFSSNRRHSSRCSSTGHDCGPLSPVELHSSNAYNDVFPEATDCHAAQCPIHQRYGGLTWDFGHVYGGSMVGKQGLAHYKCNCSQFVFLRRTERGSDCLRLLLFSFSYANTSLITTSSHPQPMSTSHCVSARWPGVRGVNVKTVWWIIPLSAVNSSFYLVNLNISQLLVHTSGKKSQEKKNMEKKMSGWTFHHIQADHSNLYKAL